ncbi:uncharacterized protein LOC129592014 [Paramacrobiotus metropolitanus]|uniref:uncharacterized protein LOC129592014 n=1 Tax=Paramacrobiotus metropolitanus TaxID=2943436 RepID=UPI0024465408|nr:uncharacterized protein LOC129592014 [Paramacrobiotus metropolitanus]
MAYAKVLTVLFGCLVGAAISQNCRMPLYPSGVSIDPLRIAGVWYEYMFYAPGTSDYNCINIYTPLNATTNSVTGVTIAFNWTITFSIKPPGSSYQCIGMCIVANVTTDGTESVAAWLPQSIGGTGTRTNLNYSILYTDYNLIEIAYRCANPVTTSLYCDSPLFWINLRSKPSALDKSTKDYVASTVNNVLTRYCFTTANMTYTNWDDTVPFCAPTPPTDCAALANASIRKPPST